MTPNAQTILTALRNGEKADSIPLSLPRMADALRELDELGLIDQDEEGEVTLRKRISMVDCINAGVR